MGEHKTIAQDAGLRAAKRRDYQERKAIHPPETRSFKTIRETEAARIRRMQHDALVKAAILGRKSRSG